MTPKSLGEAFFMHQQERPKKTFLHTDSRSYTTTELHQAISKIAATLHSLGIKKADRVALYLDNSASFVAFYLGILWLGAIAVPINRRYKHKELESIVKDAKPKLLITDTLFTALNIRCIQLQHSLDQDVLSLTATAPHNPEAITKPLARDPDDVAVIAYTSGTTGRSKGAVLSHGNFISNSLTVSKAWRWTHKDHLLLVLPLFHMHGLGVGLHGCLLTGSTLTLHRSFKAKAVLESLSKEAITMFFAVPTLYHRLLNELNHYPNFKPKQLRLLVSGSAPLSTHLHKKVKTNFGLSILERYGMTETIMTLGNPYEKRKPGSIGLPFEGIKARIADKDNKPLAQGHVGEIQLQGPSICQAYWQNEPATQASWTQDHWFKTGDLGYKDKEDYYYINGRAKDLIISGGLNIYPREVEDVLARVPGVEEVAVFGLPDEDLGESVAAAVVGEVSENTLLTHCQQVLASFKKPNHFFFVKALPKNALGKLEKHKLKDLYQSLR